MSKFQRSFRAIIKYVGFEFFGVFSFVVIASNLLQGLFWFFYKIDQEAVMFGYDRKTEAIITIVEFFSVVIIMTAYCFLFAWVYQRLGVKRKWLDIGERDLS